MNEPGGECSTDDGGAFDIAISFAGTARPYARAIGQILADNDLRVFFDEFHVSDLWGKNLVEQLSDIYENKARYCLIVISREYCERVYTNVERRSALDRAINSKTEYILPLLVDDSWIQGLPKSTAYLDLRKRSIISVCEDVYRKLAGELPPDGLGIPEDVDFGALEIGAPTTTESARYLLLSEIRQCFGQYCDALRNQNGEQARELVSEATLDFYAEMGQSALYARAEEVRSLSLSR